MDFTVGQFVRYKDKVVQVVNIDTTNNTASVKAVLSPELIVTPLYALGTLDHNPNSPRGPRGPYTQIQAETESLTPKQQAKLKFNHDLFTETGVTLSCKCGRVTRSIAPVYIRSWQNENAALNYVLSLCLTCRPSLPDFNNATQRYYGATNE